MAYIKCPKCELNYILNDNDELCINCKNEIKAIQTREQSERTDWMPRNKDAADRAEAFYWWLNVQAKKEKKDNNTLNVYYNALGREWKGKHNRSQKLNVATKESAFDYSIATEFEVIVNLLREKSAVAAGANFRLGAEWYLKFLHSN